MPFLFKIKKTISSEVFITRVIRLFIIRNLIQYLLLYILIKILETFIYYYNSILNYIK